MSKGSKKNPNIQAWMNWLGRVRIGGDVTKDTDVKTKWSAHIGTYYFYCLSLANFDPVRADVLHDSPAHAIAEAVVTKMATTYTD
jgi:hypothetical protein